MTVLRLSARILNTLLMLTTGSIIIIARTENKFDTTKYGTSEKTWCESITYTGAACAVASAGFLCLDIMYPRRFVVVILALQLVSLTTLVVSLLKWPFSSSQKNGKIMYISAIVMIVLGLIMSMFSRRAPQGQVQGQVQGPYFHGLPAEEFILQGLTKKQRREVLNLENQLNEIDMELDPIKQAANQAGVHFMTDHTRELFRRRKILLEEIDDMVFWSKKRI